MSTNLSGKTTAQKLEAGAASPQERIKPFAYLWPKTKSGTQMELPIIGATGAYQSGKTLWGLSIAPGVHPKGHPFEGQPRTLVIDFEHSSASYGGTGARRIDARHELRRIIDNRPIQPIDIYLWFRSFISKIKPDEYDCLVVDPISDVESGLTEYVRRNPAEFGYSENQFKNAAGLLFGAVKERWKIDLAAIGSVVQTFYYTVHLRMQFRDGKPTGIMEPKGKTTLEELSSLYLWLHRDPDANGVVAPVPYADIIKFPELLSFRRK
jgi:hypothetical protein